MTSLLIASLLFLGIHFLVAGTGLRGVVVGALGEKRFRAFFSMFVTVFLVWMCVAYSRAPTIDTWGPLPALKPLVLITVLLAFLFLVMGAMTRNPTVVGSQAAPDDQDLVRGILRVTRHPGMWGIGIWALSHFAVNGDWASHLFYGTFSVQALLGPLSMDRKYRRRFGERWEPYARQTSYVPFAAILAGRNRFVVGEFSGRALATAILVYILFLVLHPYLFGVSPWPI